MKKFIVLSIICFITNASYAQQDDSFTITNAQGDTLFQVTNTGKILGLGGISIGVPVGTILAWNKSLEGTPSLTDNWTECNGQLVEDVKSPLFGKTLPDLNTTNVFLMGNVKSGLVGGSATHKHNRQFNEMAASTGTYGVWGMDRKSSKEQFYTDLASSIPPYYSVVWIIKIK